MRRSRKIATAWVAISVLDIMVGEAERMFPDETGGVLLGYWSEAGDEVVITDVVGPGPAAVHTAQTFHPDATYQEHEIARIYAASDRHITYLGDWHTHPRAGAYLSRRDRQTLQRIAKHAEARAPIPLMAVLAGGDPWTLGVWILRPFRILVSLRAGRTERLRLTRF